MGDGSLASERANLLRFVTRVVGDGILADDVVQETLLRAHTSLSQFQGRAKIGTWLAAIALHVVSDHYRSPVKRVEVAADEDALEGMPSGEDVEQGLLEREMGACITAHLMALPARQRDVLALHDMGGADHAELAEALGLTEGTARVALHRARAAFRARLRQHCQLSFGSDAIPCAPIRTSTTESHARKESGRPARLL